ncbi:hypothetical protein ScPMuIL_012182 [Solemya velum]
MKGDIILGALFPIHKAPSDRTSYTRNCGEIWEQYGMHRIEMLFKTLDEINNNPNILPNITLGCDVRDSCWYSPIALEQSIDFIKASVSSLDDPSKNHTIKEGCSVKSNQPIAGLIGPGSSENSIHVQNLLQIFHIPQIGYSATSTSFSDKNLYKYFVRVVPSDRYQAQALLDIVLHFNWTYISTVYTDGNYGAKGMEVFKSRAEDHGVCIASSPVVSRKPDNAEFEEVVKTLKKADKAGVVVCFCEGSTVRGLFQATKRMFNDTGHFLIIGSDGWADRPDVVKDLEKEAIGGISVKLRSPPVSLFNRHFKDLNPFNNIRNPWFKEFWQEKFKCYIEGADRDVRYTTPCEGTEEHTHYVQDGKLGFVNKAVYAMAYALDSMQRELCSGQSGICAAMSPLKGDLYLKYLLNVSFQSYSNDTVRFDEFGDPPARYDIMNYQKNGYVEVGNWETGVLRMAKEKIVWPKNRIPTSQCSNPCGKGQVKKIQSIPCCWNCINCSENEYLVDSETCKSCSKGWTPNEDLTVCKRISIEYLSWSATESVVAICLACTGIFVTFLICMVFIFHNDTPVVKASTRELSYIIMLGIIVAFCSTFVLVAKPNIFTCYFTRILPGLSFSFIYGALVTKTNRIARILEGTKKIITKKPRFMSASAQVVITFILIGIECAIIIAMLTIEPADSKVDYPNSKRVRLICNTTTLGIIVPLGFDLVLILMCTLYAVKTRNLPENFNEAKFIGFTMYTTCVIWLGFFAIYFGSERKVITMSISISLSAYVALVLLFLPKVYVMIWAPERNTRGAFTTSKDVRCHIGSISYHSGDSLDLKRDKKLFDPSGKPCRQRTLFSRLKQKTYDKSADGRMNMTLPPEIYGNRKDSVHVSVARGLITNKDSFAWASAHNKTYREDDDRLSTISSKDDSRDSDHFGPFRVKREDSQCQTDDELLQSLLQSPKLRRRPKPLRLRSEPEDNVCLASTSDGSFKKKGHKCGDEFDKLIKHIKSPDHRNNDDDFDEDIEELDELSQILKYDGPSIVAPHCIGKRTKPLDIDGASDYRYSNKGSNVVTFESFPPEFQTHSISDTENSGNYSPKIPTTQTSKGCECRENPETCNSENYDYNISGSPDNDYSVVTSESNRNSDTDTGKRKSGEPESNFPRLKSNDKQMCLLTPKNQMNPERIECKHPRQLYSCTTNNDHFLNQFSIKNQSIRDNQTEDHRALSISRENSGDSCSHSGSSSLCSLLSDTKDSPIDLQALEDEEVSMVTFQNYLREHGVGLDISAVQSSDV